MVQLTTYHDSIFFTPIKVVELGSANELTLHFLAVEAALLRRLNDTDYLRMSSDKKAVDLPRLAVPHFSSTAQSNPLLDSKEQVLSFIKTTTTQTHKPVALALIVQKFQSNLKPAEVQSAITALIKTDAIRKLNNSEEYDLIRR